METSRNLETGEIKSDYFIKDDYNLILSDYWNILSKQAVMNGAGVIKLFFDEVAKEKQTKELYAKNRSALGKAIDSFRNFSFNTASVLYGASVTPQDLAEDAPAPTAVTAAPKQLSDVARPAIQQQPAEITSAPIVASTPTPAPKSDFGAVTLITPTETVPDWYPRQAGNPSKDSGGGGAAANNSQSITNNAGATVASDSSATTTASTTPTIIADTTAPDVALTITECAASLSAGGCLLMNGNITAHWSSTAVDLAEFELSIDGVIFPLTSATSTSATTTLADNSTHTISIRAKDTAGNWSLPETKNIEVSSRPVVINEVAWAGTSATGTNDEWLELYNRTSSDVNLANWTLYASSMKPYIPLSGTIRAKGYFLLERTDDNTVSDIPADQIYGDGGSSWALNNSGEILTLAHASTTIDQTVLCGAGLYKWCPGYDYRYMTMERKDPDILGTDQNNWDRNYYPTLIANGKTASGGKIYGTPKARNSQNHFFNTSGTITSNLTLTKAKSPYVVTNNITVNSGATLTIEPGVTIKFSGGGLTVNGTLNAQGTASEPIVFTALTDDNYGGDTNGDGTTTVPAFGSWYGIALKQGSDASRIANAVFRYGGLYYAGAGNHMANLYIENSSPSITNSIFEYSKIYGLKTQTSSSTITGNIIRNNNNATDPAGIDAGMYVSGGASQISNNTFDANHRGLYLGGGSGAVSGNTFTNHTREAIYSSGNSASFANNSGSANVLNGVVLTGTTPAGTLTLSANALPYAPNSWTIGAGGTVNVEPGAVFKPQERVYVYGNLNLNGVVPGDIIFTSPYDDTIAGDTLNDGAASTPRAGQWYGPWIYSGGSFTGTGFTMKYGGIPQGGNHFGAIWARGGMVTIANAVFDNNYPHGLAATDGSTVAITSSAFQNHNYNGPQGTQAALYVANSTSTLTNVDFSGNLLAVMSDTLSRWLASGVTFLNNTATTSPANLF